MKKILMFLLIFPNLVKCQNDDPQVQYLLQQHEKEQEDSSKKFCDTMVAACGFKFSRGQKVKMGTGAMPDGSFKFAFISSASFFRYSSNTQNYANSANAMPATFSGLNFEVLKIRKIGSKKLGYKYNLVLKNADMVRYEVDVDNAISCGEIEIPDQYKPKQKNIIVEVKNSFSVADELIKLKKLLDDGIINKDEFDAQKKKLLERKD